MRNIGYIATELSLLCKEYKDVANADNRDKAEILLNQIFSLVEEMSDRERFNTDGVFFAGELDDKIGEKNVQRPQDHVAEWRKRREERIRKRSDADDDDSGSHGNTKIPYGLCQREGIQIGSGWTPRDAWEALEGKGYNAWEVYKELKTSGKIGSKFKYERPTAQDKTLKSIIRKTANLKKEQYRIVDEDGNVVLEKRGGVGEVAATYGEKRDLLSGKVSIHNHPEGGTFSDEDLNEFGFGAKEMVVASPEGEYSLVNKKWGTKEQADGWYNMREALRKEVPTDVSFAYLQKKAQENLANSEEAVNIRRISNEFVRRKESGASNEELKKWIDESGYDKWESAYKEKLKQERRRLEVEPFDTFYKKNAEKYGFVYTFTPYKKKRMDEDDDGRWVTTENDHHVHINEEGIPDIGNPHVLATMRGEGPNPKSREELARNRLRRKSQQHRAMRSELDDAEKTVKNLEEQFTDAHNEFRRTRLRRKLVENHKETMAKLGYGKGDKDVLRKEIYDLEEQIRETKHGKETWELSDEEAEKCKELSGKRNQLQFILDDYDDCYGIDAITDKTVQEAEDKMNSVEKKLNDAKKEAERAKKRLSELSDNIESEPFLTTGERQTAKQDIQDSEFWGEMSESGKAKAMESLETMSDAQLLLLQKTVGNAKINDTHGRTSPTGASSWYTFRTGAISMSAEDMEHPRTLWHEFGHYLDDPNSSGCSVRNKEISGYEYQMSISDEIDRDNVMHGKDVASDLQKLFEEAIPGKLEVDTWESGMLRLKDVGTGAYAESDYDVAFFHVSDAMNDKFHKFIFADEEYDDYCKSIGYPLDKDMPKYQDYIEFYRTPKRNLQREREKFKGAREEYFRKSREYGEQRSKALEEHPEFYDKQQEYSARCKKREEMVAPVSDIMCGVFLGSGPWIYGSHTSEYYHRGGNAEKEAVANYHQMRSMGWTDGLKLLKTLVPSVHDALERSYNEWMWRNVDI